MPLTRSADGRLVLQCINQHLHPDDTSSTMLKNPMFHVMVVVEPPPKLSLDLKQGMPVRCYACKLCGYTELYSASIAEKEAWYGS